MTLKFLSVAQLELDQAVAWYNEQKPGLGDAFLVEIASALDLIQRHASAWQRIAMTSGAAVSLVFRMGSSITPMNVILSYWLSRMRTVPRRTGGNECG